MAASTHLAQSHGALVLSPLPPRGGTEGRVRAAAWHNLIHRLGHHVPLLVAHDLGRLLVEGAPPALMRDRDALDRGLPRDEPVRELLGPYQRFLGELSRTELVRRAHALHVSDETVAALVARMCEPVLQAVGPAARPYLLHDLPLDPGAWSVLPPAPEALAGNGVAFETAFLRRLVQHEYQVLTSAERIDLDTLRLVSLFAGDASLRGAGAALELYRVLEDPVAADVIHFSLELLPQVFETRRKSGIQRFAVDGLAGISRRGNPDQLLPSEMAWPDDVFAYKVAENELLYYGHEAERESENRVHLVLVDASASMRGARAVFARGLALTLVKKLVLLGEEVQVRFFDSRLHEAVRVTPANFRLPHLLSFRSERGRNYARVFRTLLDELTWLRRTAGRQAAVYFVTHGHCHVPRSTMEALAAVSWLYGVYVLAEDGLELDYLDVLDRHRVVGRDALGERGSRRQAALDIVDEVGGEAA